ncbi:MAG: hypothetical protein WBD99_12560 [Thermodesulfobacteriota bacterium]
MKRSITIIFAVLLITLFFFNSAPSAREDKYQVVIEESFYVVSPENQDKFLEIYKEKVYPFWSEVNKMGLIDGDIKMYSQRIHTRDPKWTYKSVVRFKNYDAIDTWLQKRDKVYNQLFPNAGGYKDVSKEISIITEEHWDELIREIPLKQ